MGILRKNNVWLFAIFLFFEVLLDFVKIFKFIAHTGPLYERSGSSII